MKITKRQLRRIIKEEKRKLLREQAMGEKGQGGLGVQTSGDDGSRLIEVEWDPDAEGGGPPPSPVIRLHQDAVADYNQIFATEGQRAADDAITEFLTDDTGWLIIGWDWK